MTEKKSIRLLASAAVMALALQENATAAPTTDAPVPPTTEQAAAAEPMTPQAQVGQKPGPAPAAQESASTVEPGFASPQDTVPAPLEQPAVVAQPQPTPPVAEPAEVSAGTTAEPTATLPEPPAPPAELTATRERMEQHRTEMMQERARRYEEMRARAAEHGFEFPQEPPWRGNATQSTQFSAPPMPPEMAVPETQGAQLGGMTPEERNARREERYQKMRARAMERRQERQERMERWDSYWKILDAMTPEQKEAIEAIFGRAHRRLSPRAMGPQMSPGMPLQPGLGQQPGQGFPSGSAFPGYGIGPRGAEPNMYERGPAASWFGQQPMHPGGTQPWYGEGQRSLQGPPPPGVDQAQP